MSERITGIAESEYINLSQGEALTYIQSIDVPEIRALIAITYMEHHSLDVKSAPDIAQEIVGTAKELAGTVIFYSTAMSSLSQE